MQNQSSRNNDGKIRYDLISPYALKGLAECLMVGAEKYEANNWQKPTKISTILQSIKRHIAEIERGNDFDAESGLRHSQHLLCNAMFLDHHAATRVNLIDDRTSFLSGKKIGLDIDDVLADLCGALEVTANDWHYTYDEAFKALTPEILLSLPAKVHPQEIAFEIDCYITSRQDLETTKKWIEQKGFPAKPIYQGLTPADKVEIAKEVGLDIFVDDQYATFKLMNEAGIMCLLLDMPHNKRQYQGFKRIKSLKELTNL